MAIKEFFKELRHKHLEKQLRNYGPTLLSSYKERAEEDVRKEYQDELDLERSQCSKTKEELETLKENYTLLQSKYENLFEIHTQLSEKVDKVNTDKGILKNEVRHLKSEIKDLQSEDEG